MAAPGVEALLPNLQVLERFATDLIPYYLCQFELEGIAVTAHPIPKDLPEDARKAAKATAVSAIPEFETLAIAVMKQTRPSLSEMEDKDIKLEMRCMAEVLQLACGARMTEGRTEVPLSELMYDDAFVHGLVVCLLVEIIAYTLSICALLHGLSEALLPEALQMVQATVVTTGSGQQCCWTNAQASVYMCEPCWLLCRIFSNSLPNSSWIC